MAGADYDHRGAVARGMSVDALVSDVELLPVAVEEGPQRIFGAVLLRIGVAGEFGEERHTGGLARVRA